MTLQSLGVSILMVLVSLTTAPVQSSVAGRQSSVGGRSPEAASPQPSVLDPRLAMLPPHLREQGRAVLAETDEDVRADLAEALAELDAAATLDFLLALLATDPSPVVREEIVDALEDNPDARVGPALEQRVLADPSPDLAMIALDLLRARATTPLLRLLETRIERVRTAGDAVEVQRLTREQERWASLVRGALLPTFFQQPPPVFSVKPKEAQIRVLAFGDFGDGSEDQRRVAGTMLQYHRRHPFDFAITLGDNFYPSGMESPADQRWRTWWSDLYDPLGIQFYAALGNHDWNSPNSPAAEVLYTRESPSWRLPATYYTFTAGPAQFFALDTDIISEAQRRWLVGELQRSTATWKIVYGHHPIYSEGQHEDNNLKIEQLLPVLKNRADVYLAGHDHDMQHLSPEGRLHFFIAGSGGKLRPITPGPRSLFAKSAHGFAVLEVRTDSLKVSFVGVDLQPLYEYTLNSRSGP